MSSLRKAKTLLHRSKPFWHPCNTERQTCGVFPLRPPGFRPVLMTGPAVRTETGRGADTYAEILIDMGGRDTTSQRAARAGADVLLVPFLPRSFDVWTLEPGGGVGREMRGVNPD